MPAIIMHASVVSRKMENVALMIAAFYDNMFKAWTFWMQMWSLANQNDNCDCYSLAWTEICGSYCWATFYKLHGILWAYALLGQPILWMGPETCPDDKVKYYSCILCYGDGISFFHHHKDCLLQCQWHFTWSQVMITLICILGKNDTRGW